MTAPGQGGLLRDLARLLAKYRAGEWQKLVSALQDDSLREDIIASIQALMPLAKPKPEAKRGGATQAGRGGSLKELQNLEPEKYRVLTGLRQEIQSGKLLASAPAVREFAEACGIREALPRNRAHAINVLLRHLAARPVEEIERTLKQSATALTRKRDFGAEYEQWVDLILHRRFPGEDRPERGD